MDMNDMNELRELSQTEEVVAVLRQAEKPISTADIFEQCKSFDDKNGVSKTLYSLRRSGKVVMDGESIHPKTKKGVPLYRLSADGEAVAVAAELNVSKAPAKVQKPKCQPRKVQQVEAVQQAFRVALASDLTLSMNLSSGQVINLSSDEVEQLHKYLTAVYGVLA